jgi:hypothetical protein
MACDQQQWTQNTMHSSVVDPNPKESESLAGSDSESENKFGFGSRHCWRMKICVKNRRSNTWSYVCFSIEEIFSRTYRFQKTYESNPIRGTI